MASEAPTRPKPGLLLDDDAHCIEWHLGAPNQALQLVVTFDPLSFLWPREPFGLEFLLRCGVDVVSVRKKSEHFYQPLSRQRFDEIVLPVAATYRDVWTYGSSLGAYAALYFAFGHPWRVVALSPRSSVHPVFGDPVWQSKQTFLHEPMGRGARSRCTVALDPRDAIDRRYLAEELHPAWPDAEVIEVPYAGHPVTQMLSETGHLAPWLRARLSGKSEPRFDRRVGRTRSSAYLRTLAGACQARDHPAWSLALAKRALALDPKDLLALRIVARGYMRLHDWPAARLTLEAALALAPTDPATLALIKQLPRQAEREPVRPALAHDLPTALPPALRPQTTLRRLRDWVARKRLKG